MNTPPLLLGAALLFWGWQTGLSPFAAITALILEGSRLVKWRWDLSRSDFNRVADLCTLMFVGMTVYLAVTHEATRLLMVIFEWLPLTFFPLVAFQVYGTEGKIDLSVFFLMLRKKARQEDGKPRRPIDLAYAYFALCIISASAANVRTPWLYAGTFVLSAWALWYARSTRFSPLLWVCLLVFVGVMGYGGHIALHNLHTALENALIGNATDPYRSSTAVGHIGTLKLSDRIMLRVEPGMGHTAPMLLREASYNMYLASEWFAMDAGFDSVQPELDGTTWALQRGTTPHKSLTISAHLKRGKGVLALPNGAFHIERLPVVEMKRNRLGAVQVAQGLGLVTYSVLFGPDASHDGPPQELDVKLPKGEAPVIARIAAELGLASQPPHEILETVSAFFRHNFQYSTFLGDRQLRATPLEDFFLRSRSGHCEYFATATVLLLKAAGLPARYATGYSVQEFSRLENLYVVRARHAHAWALVYVDGAWRDFDTTPAVWVDIEAKDAALWEPIADLWSRGVFLFSKWRWSAREGGFTKHIGWLVVPLIALLAWKLYAKKRVVRIRTEQELQNIIRSYPGADSEFYALEKRLNALALARHPWEPLASWMQRIKAAQLLSVATESLSTTVSLHYRYRFDPNGISSTEREALKANVQAWLEQHKTIS